MVDLKADSSMEDLTNQFGKISLMDFDVQENEQFIKTVFIPYFKDIFADLSEKSGSKNKSISKLVFMDYA